MGTASLVIAVTSRYRALLWVPLLPHHTATSTSLPSLKKQCSSTAPIGLELYYKRFIDDGFFVWQQDYASLLLFLQTLNSTLPNIWLTWQISQSSIDYMDITISKCMDTVVPTVGFKVTTYQKPHNQYVHPMACFSQARHVQGVHQGRAAA
jgi:hypothetical protein